MDSVYCRDDVFGDPQLVYGQYTSKSQSRLAWVLMPSFIYNLIWKLRQFDTPRCWFR